MTKDSVRWGKNLQKIQEILKKASFELEKMKNKEDNITIILSLLKEAETELTIIKLLKETSNN